MNELLLTPEERLKLFEAYYSCKAVDITKVTYDEFLCQAQLDKVLEWLNEPCTEHDRGNYLNMKWRSVFAKHRKDCSKCWQRALVPE